MRAILRPSGVWGREGVHAVLSLGGFHASLRPLTEHNPSARSDTRLPGSSGFGSALKGNTEAMGVKAAPVAGAVLTGAAY